MCYSKTRKIKKLNCVDFIEASNHNCSLYLKEETVQLLGLSSICTFFNHNIFRIYLSIDSIIEVNKLNHEIIFKNNVITNIINNKELVDLLPKQVSILEPKPKPNLIIDTPNIVGICDNLFLDSRRSSGFGGREGNISWKLIWFSPNKLLSLNDYQFNQSFVDIHVCFFLFLYSY